MTIIFTSAAEGARMEYQPPRPRQAEPLAGILSISNANPAAHFQWRMSRGSLIRVAVRCLWAAVRR
jgi:hypothetical protein